LLDLFTVDTPVLHPLSTLSLHDALPISRHSGEARTGGSTSSTKGLRTRPETCLLKTFWEASSSKGGNWQATQRIRATSFIPDEADRKSTRLNSSHEWNSYAVYCLKNNTH